MSAFARGRAELASLRVHRALDFDLGGDRLLVIPVVEQGRLHTREAPPSDGRRGVGGHSAQRSSTGLISGMPRSLGVAVNS